MDIHPFWVILQCIITGSVLMLLFLSVGKFFCVDWMEDLFDSLSSEIDGVALWSGFGAGFCLIFLWIGYWLEIEPLYVIAYLFTAMATFFYWFFGGWTFIEEFIVPKISNIHHNIRKKKNGRY